MKQAVTSFLTIITMSALFGLAYPLGMTGIAGLLFADKAGGSLIIDRGRIVGSRLIGQEFSGRGYFHGRPSAVRYDAGISGGSNFGPTSRKFIEQAAERVMLIRKENGLGPEAKIPADLVLASGSGLDPHISLESALLQVNRVAAARGIGQLTVRGLVRRHTEKAYGGLFGRSYVNVLTLNLALDAPERK